MHEHTATNSYLMHKITECGITPVHMPDGDRRSVVVATADDAKTLLRALGKRWDSVQIRHPGNPHAGKYSVFR